MDCSATLIANVAIAYVHCINKDQVQVKHNEGIPIATGTRCTQLVLAPCKTLKIG